ncbi:asparagine synthase (glutamine-hydrolyzing) [Syntrophus aciditrophicus]|uniref:asparagine synthase (glutamine-hydrolyzing) n=1 Tax=Syntrophus aciditrophicus TaxID=316277 RepID=UPI0005A2A4AC|nr:asparagine synthase (glutamine-hydrolyzing) [Syntrophus aciditrophicus]
MCGILGIINVENCNPIDQSLLVMMASSMTHRGPDGSGVWVQADGQCGLAHRRLAIVDLSEAGHQPMSTPDERVWLTFNGEIYNYTTLRKDMVARGYSFRSNSDTEVILYLYQEYGELFYEYLDGDFGLGLWDCEKRRLILIRDRAGVKPVYYTYVDGRLIFASEIKAILRYPSIDKSIDLTSFYHYLTFLVVPPPQTLVKGVYKLESASMMTLEPQKGYRPHFVKYWLPIPKVQAHRSFEEFDDELEFLFASSVKKRLMSDVPVGVLFSGGVDSTLNLCSFSKLISPEKVKTFTIGMDNAGSFHDDSTIAREMALRLCSDHHEMRINEADLLAAAEKLALLQDEPVSDPVSVPLYFVTKFAKERGVTVLQAGEGADELFCGYDNYRRFLRHHSFLWQPLSKLPCWLSHIGANILSYSNSPKSRKISDVLVRRAKGQKLFMSSAVAYYEMEKQRILAPELRHAIENLDSFNVVAPYYTKIQNECPNASFLQQLTFIELQLRLPELLLMRADKMAMANSVEVRVPFLDRDLMDFSMRVPDSYKLRNGVAKEPIKKLATKYVSKEDIYRPKTGFGVPIQQWFKGELGDALLDLLAEDFLDSASIFDRRQLEYQLKYGLRTVNEAFQLWVVYNFLVWQKELSCS